MTFFNAKYKCFPIIFTHFKFNNVLNKNSVETALFSTKYYRRCKRRPKHTSWVGRGRGGSGGFIPKVSVCLCWAPQHEV